MSRQHIAWWWVRFQRHYQADGSFIAVLPFENVSGDPDQEYFSDGLTVDIITELPHYRELSVH